MPVVILSPGRTGTSLIAGVLHKMGVDMGIDKVRKSGNNKWGTYEAPDFVDFNEKLMRAMGFKWHLKEIGWHENKFPSEEEIMEYFPAFREEAEKIVKKKDFWGWKDVRTIHSYPILFKFVKNPHMIVSKRRDRVRQIASLRKIADIHSDAMAENMINNYYRRVSKIKGHKKTFFFEDFIFNPDRTIKELANFIGYKPTKEQFLKAKNHIAQEQTKDEIKRRKERCS